MVFKISIFVIIKKSEMSSHIASYALQIGISIMEFQGAESVICTRSLFAETISYFLINGQRQEWTVMNVKHNVS